MRPPTDTQLELLKRFESEIAAADTDYKKFIKEDFLAFNRSLGDANVAPLAISPGAAGAE